MRGVRVDMQNGSWQKKAAAVALAFGLTVPAGVFMKPAAVLAAEPTNTQDQTTLFQVFNALRDLHWANAGEDKLLYGAVQGMLAVLNDPYSEYFTAAEYQQFVDAINQSYAGIGITLGQDENGYLAQAVFPGSPAEAAGIKKGDRIVAVEGNKTKDQPLEKVSGWLRGKEGTSVSLQVERTGQSPFSVTVKRQTIKLPSLASGLLDPETGYIRILTFSETTSEEFDLALADLQRKGIKSLVLDLRGNPGGIMDASVHIADRFLNSGLIVRTQERNNEQRFNADAESVDLPLSILIDRDSASASEMLAGSLHANKRAKLIGQRSFGKGVMQRGMQLANGSVLKFTIGQYYFSDGTSPQGTGLTPDVAIGLKDLQVPAAIQSLHPERAKSVKFDLANQKTYVNGVEVPNQQIVANNGESYIPLRFIMEGLGSEVTWQPEDQSVTFKYKDRAGKLSLITRLMTVNDQKINRMEPFIVKDGVSYLSLEALRDVLPPDTLHKDANTIEVADR